MVPALLQVLKVLIDDEAKVGVRANHIRSKNKATCSSLPAEYDQIFGQSENEPKFGLAIIVSQASCSTFTAATSTDREAYQYAMYRITAACCRPVTKHLAAHIFVWYWLAFVLLNV